MQKSSIRKVCALLLLLLVSAIPSPKAYGSSDIATGRFRERAPAPAAESGDGICRFFTGPRGDSLGAGEFLLNIGDSDLSNGYELELKGTFTPEGDRFRLSPDDASARAFFEGVLRRQLGDPNVAFDLTSLKASVTKPPPAKVTKTRPNRGFDEVTCKVHLSGRVTGLSGGLSADSGGSKPVSLTYRGVGQSFEAPALQGNACSTPSNLAPGGNCPDGTGCLLSFAGFKWWTSYNHFTDSGFWNNNNIWSPRNASVDSDGLHLFVRKDDVGQGNKNQMFTAGEVVALFNADGSAPAALGYGTYLVTASVKSATSWDKLDPNVAFGAFTYEREKNGDTNNPGRELDLAEISHWGTKCNGVSALCVGNSQFTLQIWDARSDNLHRYTIASDVQTVTLVMQWTAQNQPVTFKQYDGSFTLTTLPTNPSNQWTTSTAQNPFVPADGCQRFHLNLWMGNYLDNKEMGLNNPPAAPQEVVITNFQYQP